MSSHTEVSKGRVLIVEDDLDLAEALSDTLQLSGYQTERVTDGEAALKQLDQERFGLVVSDVHMQPMDGHTLLQHIGARFPELPVLLMTAYASVEKAVSSIRDGAVDYIAKPFDAEQIIEVVGRYIRTPATELDDGLIAADPKMLRLLSLAAKVACSDVTVMIQGESGTGKEVFARFLHQHSSFSSGPFVAINCAAIPETMLEATLFGYEKGAFTGAHKATPGKFELAEGGTLLLDEISEMDLGLQAKLLRVLQEREVERLGSNKKISLHLRVLTTTNRNLREYVTEGHFREDLYYRLHVFPLRLLPLRERTGDILPLANYFLQKLQIDYRSGVKILSSQAEARLLEYGWPGNVRELDNVMQRANILASGESITVGDILFGDGDELIPQQDSYHDIETHPVVGSDNSSDLEQVLQQHEYLTIMTALKGQSRRMAASNLKISERTLRYKVARLRDAGFSFESV